MDIILASASSRRRELMEIMGLRFTVIKSGADESVSPILSPQETVEELSRKKAAFVAKNHKSSCVIGSDTIVVSDGAILGKPKTEEEAFYMLRGLSGKTHTVYTGIAVICKDKQIITHDATLVTVSELTDEEIWDYIKTGDPMDKAGAYGIQGTFGKHIERIEGSYFTVVGLPIHKLYRALREVGAM